MSVWVSGVGCTLKPLGKEQSKLKKLKPHLGNELAMATIEDRILR